MKKIVVLLLMGALCFCVPKSKSDPGNGLPGLSTKLRSLMQRHELIGLAVVLIDQGQMVYQEAIGLANLRNEAPLTLQTKFRIASISKLITTIALMQLEAQGKVDLDADISQYLSDPHKRHKCSIQ